MRGTLLGLLLLLLLPFSFAHGSPVIVQEMVCRFLALNTRDGLWGVIISFPFVKEGPVYPMLKVIWKEALKHLS